MFTLSLIQKNMFTHKKSKKFQKMFPISKTKILDLIMFLLFNFFRVSKNIPVLVKFSQLKIMFVYKRYTFSKNVMNFQHMFPF